MALNPMQKNTNELRERPQEVMLCKPPLLSPSWAGNRISGCQNTLLFRKAVGKLFGLEGWTGPACRWVLPIFKSPCWLPPAWLWKIPFLQALFILPIPWPALPCLLLLLLLPTRAAFSWKQSKASWKNQMERDWNTCRGLFWMYLFIIYTSYYPHHLWSLFPSRPLFFCLQKKRGIKRTKEWWWVTWGHLGALCWPFPPPMPWGCSSHAFSMHSLSPLLLKKKGKLEAPFH